MKLKIPFYVIFFRHLHHWGWCQHIWAVSGEDSQWLGACCSQTVLFSSRIPSCIGPKDKMQKREQSVLTRCNYMVDTLTHITSHWHSQSWWVIIWMYLLFPKFWMFALCMKCVGGYELYWSWKTSSHSLISCYWELVKLV